MKIGIIGTHCSGKTSLIDKLYSNPVFAGYDFLEEPIREVSRSHFRINQDSDDAAQFAMLACHLRNLQYEKFVSDRTLLDLYVYCCTLHNVSRETKDFIFKMVLKHLDSYDYLFWCAPEFEMKDDGFRQTDKKWQMDIEKSFETAVNYLNKNNTLKHCKIIRLTGETIDRAKTLIKEVFGK